jgi:flagellar hook-length control protein FliK
VSTVPTDLVPPVSALARGTSSQAGAQSSGETSPFEAFLSTGHAPPSQSVPSPRAGATGQSTTPTTAANHQQTPGATPGHQPPPSHGSTDGSSAHTRLTPSPQPGAAADATDATAAKSPMPTLTDPPGPNASSTTGDPMTPGTDSAAPGDPPPATSARKSDKASVKADEAGTVSPLAPAPPPVGSVATQVPAPTIIAAAAVAAPPPAPAAAAGAPTLQTGAAATAAVSVTAPPPGAAFGASAPTPTEPVPEPSSLPLDPTTPDGLSAAGMGSVPTAPTAPESPSEKAGDGTPASADTALAKPAPASASTTPALMASSEAGGGPVQSTPPQVHVASAAAATASHADVAVAAGPHFDPVDSADPARSGDAAGSSGPDPGQSITPPVSAISSAPATTAPATAATTASYSPPAVPISGLAIEIAARATGDEKSFQIRLDPPELGRIDVQLNVDAGGHVTTHLTVDRPETLNLLRQDASSLQRALESTGLKANSAGLEFSLRNHSFGGQGGGQRGGQSNGTTSSVARIVVSDADMPAGQTATRGYARPLGVGTGVDIRV